ncbi:unnamed protein product, partial [Brassica rapa subsp. narinosa]
AELDQIKKKKEWRRGSRRYVFLSVFFTQCKMITITIESHSNFYLNFFADLDRLIDAILLWSCDEPKVVIRESNVSPFLAAADAISATNFYFGMSTMLGKVFLSENFS